MQEIKQGRRAGNPFQAGSQRSGGSDSNTSVQGTVCISKTFLP